MLQYRVYFRIFFKLATVIVLMIPAAPAQSFADTVPATPINETAQNYIFSHTIRSTFSNQERNVSVRLPKTYHERPNANYPVLYILDGENNFEFTTASASFLEDGGQIPELIIVALHAGTTRDADYFPDLTLTDNQRTGEARDQNPFLNYIEKELIPFIDKTYRTSKYRAVSGHSLGGLFVTYTLTQAPDLFDAYYAQSPAFEPNTRELIVQRISALHAKRPNIGGSFSMTLGDESSLEEGFNTVKTALSHAASLNLWASRQPGRSHMQTRMIGIYEALEQSFAADWPLTQAARSTDIAAHFIKLESKYGTNFYDEEAFSQAVQALLQNRDASGGIAMSKIFRTQYPDSLVARFLLVNAYAVGKDNKRAITEIDATLAFIETQAEPTSETQQFKAQLLQMKKRLSS